jgi:hypothetical protein
MELLNLPNEIIEIIISYLDDEFTTSTVNKRFCLLTDNDIINKGTTIIIDENKFSKWDDYFGDYSDTLDHMLITYSNEIMLCLRQIKESSGVNKITPCEFKNGTIIPSKISIWIYEKIQFNDCYFYYRKTNHNINNYKIFLPSAQLIDYYAKSKRLGNNHKFRYNTIINTLNWYCQNIKNTKLKGKDVSHVADEFKNIIESQLSLLF